MKPFISLLCGLSLGACAAPDDTGGASFRVLPVVYGADGRTDVTALPEASLLRQSARSVAVLIARDQLHMGADGRLHVPSVSLRERAQLCAGEPFAEQRAAAYCTGALIDDNLLASAGHCFASQYDCDEYVVAFDYLQPVDGSPPSFDPTDVYDCLRVVVREDDESPESGSRDYAIVELSRPVAGRTPLAIRKSAPRNGQMLTVIGASSGLPLKVDEDVRVVDDRQGERDFFTVRADTAGGASGAPLLDETMAIAGLLVRGNVDFVLDEDAGCHVTNVLPEPAVVGTSGDIEKLAETGHRYGEEVSLLEQPLEALCVRGYASQRLCGIEARCGDAFCSGGESALSCESDCSRPTPPSFGHGSEDAGAEETQKSAPRGGGCNVGGNGGSGSALLVFALGLLLARRPR